LGRDLLTKEKAQGKLPESHKVGQEGKKKVGNGEGKGK